ncbi:hypothetical protein Ocin01_14157 [Orchesella cincta]|uniref:3-hydroxyacyl-CoA dehydrogenase n=1 Tax=Orchesella cincta TaxID=48709 RepID=A0A1D2MHP2_ORCCI|nr:hypothetical protein Ocin01_14157 [Orchesella cincta]
MSSVRLLRCMHVSDLSKQTFRGFSVSTASRKAFLHNVTVIGSGHMGTGIAQNAGVAGNNVIIADLSQSSLDRSRKRIEDRLLKVTSKKLKGKSEEEIKISLRTTLEKFKWTTDIVEATSTSDLVVESIPERIELKHKLFAQLDKIAPTATIFATNTSSIPVNEIAQAVSTERRKNFGGTHFFDRDVKLVEVVRTGDTSNETFHKLMEWGTYIGKVPVACKDTPGFIANRLNLPYFINAVKMYERGDAEMRDIDMAMKLGAGYPFGPFELADHIGLDTLYDIIQGWQTRFPNEESFRCPEIISRLYKEGKFGRKSGEGFFKYNI